MRWSRALFPSFSLSLSLAFQKPTPERVSSLAVAGLVNLVQAQRLVHQAALAHNGPVSAAVAQQAQVLAYQDVYLLSALSTLPLIVLAFFLRTPDRKSTRLNSSH